MLPWFEDDRVQSSLAAARTWWRDSDIPDPLDYADVLARPDLLAASIRRRVGDGDHVGRPRAFPFPKAQGGFRRMLRLDPLSELLYRQIVSQAVDRVERTLPDSVFSSRCLVADGTWSARNWREERPRFDNAVRSRRSPSTGETRLDVASHYPTITMDGLGRVLNSIGVSGWTIAAILEFLGELAAVPGMPAGLPIGPEASAPLGTLALLPVDRRVLALGFVCLRWMDDMVIPGTSAASHDLLVGEIQAQVARAGQTLNPAKTEFADFSSDVPAVSSGGAGAPLVEDPVESLMISVECHDPRGVAFALGCLRSRHDPSAVAIAQRSRWLCNQFPKQLGKYITAVQGSIQDWTWVLARVCEETTADNAASQLHLARALPLSEVSRTVGAELFDRATGLRRGDFAPLADQLFAVAGRSQERAKVRRRRAADLALERGELGTQRALLAAFAGGDIGRHDRQALMNLRRVQPELSPTVEWALVA